MYFAYGWPKVAYTDLQLGDTYIYLKATEKFLFAVSRTRVQLWTGGLHRIKLSECVRAEDDVKQEGAHMAALWSPAKAILAVLTSGNYLHLYAIHTWKDHLVHPSCNIALKDIQKVDIYLKSSIRLDSEYRALSLTGDNRLLLIGFADGTVASLSWSGKMKEVAYPLDDATDFDAQIPGTVAEAAGTAAAQGDLDAAVQPPEAGASSSVFAAAATSTSNSNINSFANGYSHAYSGALGGLPLSRAIVQMSYCEHSKQVVMVLADGACAVCGTSPGGLGPLPELCFGRWLCGPQHQAVCAQVGARAQLIAVGRENGEVELYRLHRTAIGAPGGPEAGPPSVGRGSLGTNMDAAPGLSGGWEPPVRTLSLENWGHKVQQTGPVSQVEWSPDGRAIAVAYAGQGVVVWSPSGCRLMCSLRQPSPSLSTFPSAASRGLISHQTSLSGRGQGQQPESLLSTSTRNLVGASGGPLVPMPPQVPLDGGISAISWGPLGYQLAVAEMGCGAGISGTGGGLLEVMFAHSLPGQHRVARGGVGGSMSDEEVHVLLGHDRLLLIREAGEAAMGVLPWAGGDTAEPAVAQAGDLTVSHVPLPHSYVASNWPLQRCAISASGSDIAVSGRNGLAVYNRMMERWRLFGDISQERQVSCRALGWLANGVLVACSGPDPYALPSTSQPAASGPLGVGAASAATGGPTGNELLLLPRYHLDLTSLLARHPLQQPPLAMDCLGSHILLASEPLEITLLEVTLHGDLSPTGDPRATITTLREISMFDVGRQLSDVALVPLVPVPLSGPPGGSGAAAAAAAASSAPRQCVLLRWGGLLSVLDLEKGAETMLATEIEAFWLSDAITCQTGGSGGDGEGSSPWGMLGAGGAGPQPAAEDAAPETSRRSVAGATTTTVTRATGSRGASAGGAPPSISQPQQGEAATDAAGRGAFASAAGAAAAAAAGPSAVPSAATLDVEMPWWLYGPAGMQLCFPSSLGTGPVSSSVGAPKEGHDIELEFDQEVYPVGISLADDAIVGITQRIVRGPAGMLSAGNVQAVSASQLPCFHPIPESQPVLPCLLRRLLQRGAFQEAVSLARRHARGPHFARSLEWLLFTALEIDTNTPSLARPGAAAAASSAVTGKRASASPEPTDPSAASMLTHQSSLKAPQQSLLAAAADLVRHFPNLFAEVVVSVARKTDAALWPPLFDAVGSPSRLLDGLVEAGELASAACFLLIIDRLEGAPAAQAQALRLMHSSLLRGQYPLCCELLRFVVPPSDQELSLTSELSLGGTDPAAAAATGASEQKEEPAVKQQSQPAVSASATADKQEKAAEEDQERERQRQAGDQQQGSGRTWLGWLLGYSDDTTPQGQDSKDQPDQRQEQQKQQPQPSSLQQTQQDGPLPTAVDPDGAPAAGGSSAGAGAASSPVRKSLALLGEAGGSVSASRPAVPGSPAMAQLLLSSASAVSNGGSTAAAKSACKLVAEHAWGLLEAGHVAALGQLAQASSFLPGGLAGLMNQHRASQYAVRGCGSHTALELLSALAIAVAELPVWSSEDVELLAIGVEALCRQVGAVAWAVAMAVLLVDANTVTAFRRQQPTVWAEFVQMLHEDASFSYLWDIVEVLSEGGEGAGAVQAVPPGRTAGVGMGVQQGAAEATVLNVDVASVNVAAAGAGGMFVAGSPTASVGHVELRTISVVPMGSEIEEGPQTPLASIPGPKAGEVSIGRG